MGVKFVGCVMLLFFILVLYDLTTLVVVTLVEVREISVHLSTVSDALLEGAVYLG